MEIRIHIADERKQELTMGALCTLEDIFAGKEPSSRGMRELVAPFMQNANGEWLDDAAAFEVLDRVKQKNFADVVFKPFLEAYKDHLIPKANGNSSSSPSTTEETGLPGSGT